MNQRNYYTVESLSPYVGRGIWLVSFQFAPCFGTLKKLDAVTFRVTSTPGHITFNPVDILEVQEHGNTWCFELFEPKVIPVVSTAHDEE